MKQPQPVVFFRQQTPTPGAPVTVPEPAKVVKLVAAVLHHEPVPPLCTTILPSHGTLNPKLKFNG